jgi:aspartate/methionine/tyrosine aminotransferase
MIVSLAQRLQQVQEYYFSQKLEQIAQMRAKGIQVINLGIGSPDLSPPEAALSKAKEIIDAPTSHGYASYRSLPELRGAMSEWYQSAYRVKLNPASEILPLLGSKEGILYLSMALLNPGDKVLIPNPGYPAYASVAHLLGAQIIYYDLTEESGWLPDLKKLQERDLSGTKLMWVNYPHMPTGQVATKEFFDELVAFAKNKKILLCNDNPYSLILNEEKPLSLFSSDPQMEVSCELNSLSKSFNMAGWRVGMFLGARDLVDAVVTMKSNVDSGMFAAIQRGAIEALKVGPSWHEERNDIYRQRREMIWEIFELLGLCFNKKQVGLFVWGRVPDSVPDVTDLVDKILLEAHVFLTPGKIFGSNGERYIRASLCAPKDSISEAKKRIKEFLA